ncbi:MAG TPA: 2-hydroxychromene-2-carboxylate isomerase [Solirubrobacteraceae bacterium]|nr:2-hydroxychromene-2-carboxylate isomerase [Solirubrobacteraceae bacterium]
MPELIFYFDLGSPYAYLAAERLESVIPEPARWQPVLLGGLFKLTGRSSWALGDYERRQRGMAEIEQRARGYGAPALRWPDPWPSDYLVAMRATTYAFAQGRGREFTAAAYRAAFQHGRDLSIAAHVLEAARAAGLDPEAVVAGIEAPEVKATLRGATDAAYARGVFGVPTVAVGDELFWGDDRLEDAAAELRRATVSGGPG